MVVSPGKGGEPGLGEDGIVSDIIAIDSSSIALWDIQESSRKQVTLMLLYSSVSDFIFVSPRPGECPLQARLGLPIPQLSLPGHQVGSGIVREIRQGRPKAQTGDQKVKTVRTDCQVFLIQPQNNPGNPQKQLKDPGQSVRHPDQQHCQEAAC